MAITDRDWALLKNGMLALDTRMDRDLVSGVWDLPSNLTGDAAREYLLRVWRRLNEIKAAVEKARDSGIQRVKDAAGEISRIAGGIAEHAAKVAEDVATDLSGGFRSIAGYFEESAKTVATVTFGALLALIALFFAFKGRD